MSGGPFDRWTVVRGAVAGAGGFALAYLATALAVHADPAPLVSEFELYGHLFWVLAGWAHYDAQFVGVSAGATTYAVVVAGALSPAAYRLVPPAALVAAGFVAGLRADVAATADRTAAGALVVAGYLPTALGAGLAMHVSMRGAVVGPSLVRAAVVAGLAYPLLFGAVGGALAGLRSGG